MTIVITGANRGIGRALYDLYTAEGHDVFGTHRRAEAAPGWITLDVRDPAQHGAMADTLRDRPVSLLICDAGVYLDKGAQLDTGFAAGLWADTFATNVTGVFLSVQSLLPNLRMAGDAKVAIIASQMGSSTHAPGGAYIYRASKAAAINLGRNLSKDLAKDGIAVGIYHPGWVRTDMGGSEADISEGESADGLILEFSKLSLETTGCFKNYDGEDLQL